MLQHDSRNNYRSALRLLMLTALLGGALAVTSAHADLVGAPTAGLVLSEADKQLLSENPALRQLATNAPELLADALAIIAAAQASGVTSRGSFDGLDDSQVRLLGQNPALLQVWRSSPEASADLLQLIRTAAGGKTQK